MSSIDEPVTLVPYNAAWPEWYERESARLRRQLSNEIEGIEHIGSTAVPGMPAKPIIDIMVGIGDFRGVDDLVPTVITLGYEDCGGAPGRRYLRQRGEHAYNIQVVEYEGDLWNGNVTLRDYLRSHPDASHAYADLKAHALKSASMLLAYSDAKADGLLKLLGRAQSWASQEPDS